MTCKCGHERSEHDDDCGCFHEMENGYYCFCEKTPTSFMKADYAALVNAAREYLTVSTFREVDGLCYHCAADETMEHSEKCQYRMFQNALASALLPDPARAETRQDE